MACVRGGPVLVLDLPDLARHAWRHLLARAAVGPPGASRPAAGRGALDAVEDEHELAVRRGREEVDRRRRAQPERGGAAAWLAQQLGGRGEGAAARAKMRGTWDGLRGRRVTAAALERFAAPG